MSSNMMLEFGTSQQANVASVNPQSMQVLHFMTINNYLSSKWSISKPFCKSWNSSCVTLM